MQKVLRRTHLAKQQAKRRARIREGKEHSRDRVRYREQTSDIKAEWAAKVRDEKRVRREAWELGPLSPYPNLFSTAFKEAPRVPLSQFSEFYGTLTAEMSNPPAKPKKERVKDWFIQQGDRVVVMRGNDAIRGRIGTVRDCNEESETVTIDGINKAEVTVPEPMRGEQMGNTQVVELPIPLADVNLVYPLPDPVTGIPRDAIIRLSALKKRDAYFDVYENKTVWSRVLHPQQITIPWPEQEEVEYQDEDGDTLRINVEESTFLPTLLRPPMPLGVIDELRNKYSKFRDRHDDEYVAKKMAEDEAIEEDTRRSAALVPRGAHNIARLGRSSKTEEEQAPLLPTISDEDLEVIGKAMAESRIST